MLCAFGNAGRKRSHPQERRQARDRLFANLRAHPLRRQPLEPRRQRSDHDAGDVLTWRPPVRALPEKIQLAAIHRATGATSAADIGAAIESGTLHSISGVDDATEKAIAGALPVLRAAIPRIPLGRAIMIVDPIVEQLRATAGIEWAVPAGSLRRAQDTVGDLEIVASAPDPSAAIDDLSRYTEAGRVLHRSERRIGTSVR